MFDLRRGIDNSIVRLLVLFIGLGFYSFLPTGIASLITLLVTMWISHLIGFQCRCCYITVSLRFPFLVLTGDPVEIDELKNYHYWVLAISTVLIIGIIAITVKQHLLG